MRLITERPISMPILQDRMWRDDFARTGGIQPGYTVSAGTKTPTAYGIRLSNTTGTGTLQLPSWATSKNMEIETVCRNAGGAANLRCLYFRYADAQNHLFVQIQSTSSQLTLWKRIASTPTQIGALSQTIDNTQWTKPVGIRAIGSTVEVYWGGKLVISTSGDSDVVHANLGALVAIEIASSTNPTGEWQYIAARRL